MDTVLVYGSAVGGVFCIFVLVRFLPSIAALVTYVSLGTSKHLVYPYLLHRHRIVGPWSRVGVLVQLIYVAVNVLCLVCRALPFRASTISEAGLRAGTLTLVNAIPLFAGLHLAFLADQLGVSLRAVRRLHRSVGFMTFSLALLHVFVLAASKPVFPLTIPRNKFAVIGGSALCFVVLLAYPLFRKPSYELFLRTHQALAALFVYSTWRHLPSNQAFPRAYVYISLGLFMSMFTLQTLSVVLQNGVFRYHLPRADITHSFGAVRVRMRLQKRLKISDGQYLNLWIPFASLWSSHPFMVVSWAPGEQDTIDLLFQPQQGITSGLLHHAKGGGAMGCLVMFSGPHGTSVAMDEYETVLMVATGFGIAAHLAHLKRLIYGYKARSIRARRIHLVWQIRDRSDGLAAQSLLNSALEEDELDDGCILSISIYLESESGAAEPFGKRATAYPGPAPLQEIFLTEVSGKHIKKSRLEGAVVDAGAMEKWEPAKPPPASEELESNTKRDGKMLVTVSSSEEIRDQLRILVRDFLQDGVRLIEPDYQPSR